MVQGLGTKRFDQKKLSGPRGGVGQKWCGPKVVRPQGGQKWCGNKVVWARSGAGRKWSLSGFWVQVFRVCRVLEVGFFGVEKIGPKHLKTKFAQSQFGQSRSTSWPK